jgi:hypothetical protein
LRKKVKENSTNNAYSDYRIGIGFLAKR